MRPPVVIRCVERALWVVAGALLCAILILAAVLTVLASDAFGRPVCEPDEAAGCGSAVMLSLAILVLPPSALLGGVVGNRLFRRVRPAMPPQRRDG